MLLDFRSLLEPSEPPRKFVSNATIPQADTSWAAGCGLVVAAAAAILSVPKTTTAVPQSIDQPQPVIFQAATVPAQLPRLLYASWALDDRPFSWVLAAATAPAAPPPSAIGQFVSSFIDPQSAATPQGWPISAAIAGHTPPVIQPIVAAPELRDYTLQAVTFRPEPNLEGPVLPTVGAAAAPQAIDLTQQAAFQTALVSGHTPPVIAQTIVPQQGYVDVQPLLLRAIPPHPIVPGLVVAAPAWDLTQQASLWAVSVAPPVLTGAVPKLVTDCSAPQVMDLTLQATFQIALGQGGVISGYFVQVRRGHVWIRPDTAI